MTAAVLLSPAAARAYVGPGAGFAVVGSLGIVFVTAFLAGGAIISWPFRTVVRWFRSRRRRGPAQIKRAIVLGLDGLDPVLARRFMDEGKLPNFSKMAQEGSFLPLGTACPSMSPVAWSSFATGVDASRHNIFDFMARDEKTYMPILSSTRITNPDRSIKLGKYRIPLGKPVIRLMRKSKTFWRVLDEAYVPCHILRVPITFPPEKLKNGALLSAMCTPDLRGSQGSFTLFTTDQEKLGSSLGGTLLGARRDGRVVTGQLPGPPNPFTDEHEVIMLPWKATIGSEGDRIKLEISGEKLDLKVGEYTDWVGVIFKPGLGIKVRGICKIRLLSVEPQFELYISPINLDPASPAMPISSPSMFSQYLARLQGPFATLGLAEDTWALNERLIDEQAFLDQAYAIHDEREQMFFNSLEKNRSGLTVCVFDATDRIQHMFMRYLDEDHPANRDKDREEHKGAIQALYVRMDDLLGRTLEHVDDKTLLLVVSDHGFKQFKRGVNLNNWLVENGYMTPKNGQISEYLQGTDWSRTGAYQLGLSGIYLNRKGREAQGILDREAYKALKRELKEKLEGLLDPETGKVAITSVYDTTEMMSGPYAQSAPDLIIGYNVGYRASWDAAVGRTGEAVFEDNTRSWGGDHCIDYRFVPGVLFSSRKVEKERPDLRDIGPSILELFGVPVPEYMDGGSIFQESEHE